MASQRGARARLAAGAARRTEPSIGYGDIWARRPDELALDVAAPGSWEPFFELGRSGRPRARAAARLRRRARRARGRRARRGSRLPAVARRRSRCRSSSRARPAEPALPAGLDAPNLRHRRDADVGASASSTRRSATTCSGTRSRRRISASSTFARAGFDPSLWLLAWRGDELAGSVLALPAARRRHDARLGRARSACGVRGGVAVWAGRCSARAFAALHDRGLATVGLGVDAENATGALAPLRAGWDARRSRQSDNWVLDL